MPSNFRCEGTIQDFLIKHEIPGIAGIDTRALTKILREKGTMNGMITTREDFSLEEILPSVRIVKFFDFLNDPAAFLRVSRPVAEHNSVGFFRQNFLCRRI